MVDVDLSTSVNVDLYQPFTPTAVVSAIVPGVRKVTVSYAYGSYKSELTSIVDGPGNEGIGMDKLNEFDGRLRSVETAVTRIDERIKHMPTTIQTLSMVGVLGVIVWAVVQFVGPGVVKAAFAAHAAEQATTSAPPVATPPPADSKQPN